ncbi:ABC transporter ATP-binding protein [Dactylosporangium fulvum]|uniref:ABC transporter ATP-binding protein n=1 Tax=Dactylosporangium fulvum TaxID=53359 RepID=A0ABY5VRR5_9ACTN|nr:ABC transporter ATP-binding protein [Dactylosporangium fulvum]UWP79880.1 ABC transporter ATP-binding protein [Dactylosporangium fulvum]
MTHLLSIDGLTVQASTRHDRVSLVEDVSLQIRSGETLCLIGESGSGKTVTAKAIMRLTDFEGLEITAGEITLDGQNITRLHRRDLQRIRGRKVAMVFQEPLAAFDPLFSIGSQLTEVVAAHDGERLDRRQRWEHVTRLLERVGIPDPQLRMKQLPSELSGGTLQRAMIAMALAGGPDLLIADEPTTALDTTVQAQVLHLLKSLQAEFGMSILLITHDMGIAAQLADRIAVMYAGRVVEHSDTVGLFRAPQHPYTAALLRSVTSLDSNRNTPLLAIDGSTPSPLAPPSGCRFHPRCPVATDECRTAVPPLRDLGGRSVACWHTQQLVAMLRRDGDAPDRVATTSRAARPSEALIEVRELTRTYSRAGRPVHAVDGVTLQIRRGETLGLVGESGSGKSTLGRLITRLESPDAGRILYAGQDLTALRERELKAVRRHLQTVFQDPYGSMNPRWRVGEIVSEPLAIHTPATRRQRRTRAGELLETVGLPAAWIDRFPHQLSGGQRQRVGLARAIALDPAFIVADEAVSALDVSVQAQIVNLMQNLQRQLGLTYLFIAHGLHTVRHISDRVAVMYFGRIVELAAAEELFAHPAHHYTRQLIAATPWPDPERQAAASPAVAAVGRTAPPDSTVKGCRFAPLCPAVSGRCSTERPELAPTAEGHLVACHHPLHRAVGLSLRR